MCLSFYTEVPLSVRTRVKWKRISCSLAQQCLQVHNLGRGGGNPIEPLSHVGETVVINTVRSQI